VLVSAALAGYRGIVREFLSLLTWAGAALIAVYLFLHQPPDPSAPPDPGAAPPNALESLSFQAHDMVRELIKQDPLISAVVLCAAVFLVAIVVLHLLTMWIADLISDSKLGPLDRSLGVVFGIGRGVLIAVVFAIFGGHLLGLQDFGPFKDSKTWPTLSSWGDQLMARLPGNLLDEVSKISGKDNPADAGGADETPAAGPNDAAPDDGDNAAAVQANSKG
jgi:membrane protein required for colicin V production